MLIIYRVNYELLREKRREKGFTLNEMAKLLNLSNRVSYFHKEHGDNPFKDQEIAFLVPFFGITFNDFFTKED